MRLKVLACETVSREAYLAAALSPHVCDIKLLPRAYHDDLDAMRRALQEEVECTNTPSEEHRRGITCPVCLEADYDAVILMMGLCGNTTQGLRAPCVPLVLPRVHDCSGLLLGGNAAYLKEEKRTVFYHQGAVERLGAARVDAVPRRLGLGRSLEEYISAYGEDNGRYIYEMEYNFARYNERALYLYHERPVSRRREHEEEVRQYIERFGWGLESVQIEMGMITRLLSGCWSTSEVIVVPPGETVDLEVKTGGEIIRRGEQKDVQENRSR